MDGGVVNYTGTPTSSFTFTVPAGTAAGDVFIISVASNTDDFTFTGPSGSTVLVAASQSSWGFVRTITYLYVVPSTVPGTLSVGASTSVEGSIAWMRFRGVDTANPLAGGPAVKALGSTSATNQVAPTITTAVDGAFVIGGLNVTSGSVGVTPPAGWTVRANGSRRKGVLATKAVQAAAGSAGAATWTLAAANDAQAWQAALRPAGAAGGPEQVDGASTASLTAPAARWAKGTMRAIWCDATSWRAVLPTATGHRLFQLVEGGDAVQGAVVDSRQDARPTVVHDGDWTGVLRIHPTASRFTAYDASYTATVTDAAVPLTAADSDASPAAMCRSANGHLWAAVDTGSSVAVSRSTDGGATWGAAQSVITTTAATGVVSLVTVGTTVVLIATENDGGGRHVRSIAQATGSYAAGSWATETLPAFPSGTTSDDHLAATAGLDGRV